MNAFLCALRPSVWLSISLFMVVACESESECPEIPCDGAPGSSLTETTLQGATREETLKLCSVHESGSEITVYEGPNSTFVIQLDANGDVDFVKNWPYCGEDFPNIACGFGSTTCSGATSDPAARRINFTDTEFGDFNGSMPAGPPRFKLNGSVQY